MSTQNREELSAASSTEWSGGTEPCGCEFSEQCYAFRILLPEPAVSPSQLIVYGASRTYAECLRDALLHWSRTNHRSLRPEHEGRNGEQNSLVKAAVCTV
jgi:hypothetical protein